MNKEHELLQLEQELRYEKERLESQKKAFERQVAREEQRIEQKRQLFETQMRLLQKEAVHLSKEWEELKREQANLEKKAGRRSILEQTRSQPADSFFAGVNDVLSLKKRYRDLIKIYHPDNLCGDSGAMKNIVEEYEKLKDSY